MKYNKFLILFFLFFIDLTGQEEKKIHSNIREIYDISLVDGKSYNWLEHLSNNIGGRLSGSLNAERAILWAKEELENLGLDSVWLQPVMVPKWVRGNFEYANIETSPGNTINVPICALGGSIATPLSGIRAEVVEVKNFDDLKLLGKEKVAGKIVFFNRPMQDDLVSTFESYSNCVDQRYDGARIASKYGALAVIVRSMNLRLDDFPHTGVMSYGDIPNKRRIPAAAISTNGAELLSSMLSLNPNLKFFIKQNCKNFPDVLSYNVIGEIKGSIKSDEIMLVGGHLDSWDLGDGAHDDGAGIVQSMEVLRIFKKNKYKLKRTLRVVLFMNEENGKRGGIKYAENARKNYENHVLALESDAGGFSPRGFSISSNSYKFDKILSWKKFFKPYQIHYFEKGGSGADIEFLKTEDNVLIGLRPDSQRYFDYHHASTDTFEAINKRELELGAATMATLIYLADYFQL
ncbi:MAG: M20/M25/M40 family metallo-hydrolase [Flavobacteriaceae bacterium]|nr:M20/M25/M40 family metallo-hydrolase [Flavobacteriaceae bacterium]